MAWAPPQLLIMIPLAMTYWLHEFAQFTIVGSIISRAEYFYGLSMLRSVTSDQRAVGGLTQIVSDLVTDRVLCREHFREAYV